MIKLRRITIFSEDGFTLIELLIVIGVLGILAAIAIPRISGITDRAKLAEAQTTIGSIRNSLELIYNDQNSYTSADTGDYKTASALLADTNLNQYLDNLSDKWRYNIAAVTDNYLIEVIGNGSDYPVSLKASLRKGDAAIITTTKNEVITASTLP
ncbi:general secretion pathway protein G [Halanaerobium saccharolyticum]|uniref:General secretion pathway protein G n=1 Tax=Halanaerobium saccharolyticum TaxID=43595 RepID=A0A4V3CZ75_9FIRM|nr:prepilin-type N-terminal cleavage/methylation domain-containing protein [Halanaerobium saccharolyticum]TDP96948.1 general secretion pathway protein G [Halanaerobium saccharolyticum]